MSEGRARIAASILDADLSNLGHAVRRAVVAGADRIHIDVMDGHFVPNLTFGPRTIGALRRHTEAPLDAHLMISDPGRYLDEYLEAGCDSITFHVEVSEEQIEPTLRRIRQAGRAAGLALRPATPLSALDPYRGLLDIVMVMTVEPGFGGQSFMTDVARVKLLPARDHLAHKAVGGEIHVDGGVNRESAELIGSLGADVLIVGSALWVKGHDPAREIRLIRALADEGYQYGLNAGVPPVSPDRWVAFASLPRPIARRFMAEIEEGGIPVVMLRGDGLEGGAGGTEDGARGLEDGVGGPDYELLVPATAESLTLRRHAEARERYAREAREWRARADPEALGSRVRAEPGTAPADTEPAASERPIAGASERAVPSTPEAGGPSDVRSSSKGA